MNQAEKEAYLREYSILKNQGKPFFPYAVAKDAIDGGDRDGRDHLPGADVRRRARAQGRPDDDHLRAAAGLVLLLPVRGPARDEERPEVHADGHDRRADDLHDPAVPAAVLRPQPGAADRAPPDRAGRRHRHDRRDGLPDLLGRQHRLAELGRHEAAGQPDRAAGGDLQGRASWSSGSRAAWPAT